MKSSSMSWMSGGLERVFVCFVGGRAGRRHTCNKNGLTRMKKGRKRCLSV